MRKKLLILLLATMLILSLAACGGGGTTADPTPEPEAPAELSVIEEFLADYSDEIRDMADMMIGGLGEGSRVELAAGTGNELIYNFIFGEGIDFEGVEGAFDEIFVSMGPFFEMLADTFREELELPNMRVTVRYYDYDGNLLAAESFDSAG